MSGIRAFVAHSFSSTEKALIGIFVEHFNRLASSLPNFSWDHDQQAAPESVSDKVLAKIQDKNVFIGICTRNECAIQQAALSRVPILKLMRFNEADGQWKTSDW